MRPSKAKKESLAMAMAIDRDADAEYTSESEADLTQRSYAAVVARPGTPQTAEGRPPPPGPPPSGPPPAGSRSPSPRQGGSGTRESSKKRKRGEPMEVRLQDSDSEETEAEQHPDFQRMHQLMEIELANAHSRAVSLQDTVDEFQRGLAQSTSMNDAMKKREVDNQRLHVLEMKDQKDKVNTLQEREAQRVLAAHRQQLRTSEPEGPASALQGAERGVATRPLGPAPHVVATGSGAPREPTASRQEMQKFQGLKACLRKPCPRKTDCRNLHVSFDELTRCLATQPSGTPTAPRWRAPTTQRREASPPRRPTTPERRRRTSHSPRPARESPRRRARGTRSRTRSSSEELRAARVVLEKMMWKRRKK
eukprot:GFUD01017658.1.p1 GENE.GFUD01017658.1~~GFUD01017658.1.p1  ORF type:complete len:380 (+),score=71.50 GFUD01017658.1:46-1140(+)